MHKLSMRLTGKQGEVDGYMEMLLGFWAMSGVLVDYTATKKNRNNGTVQIYLDFTLKAPPLGHLGEDDIPERKPQGKPEHYGNTLDDFKRLVRDGDYVVLDTETTGLHRGEICEISIINQDGDVLLDTLVHTVHPIPPDAQRIHGISDDMVMSEDIPTWLEIQPTVREILRGRHVVIYNATYDRKMMHQSDEATGLDRVDYKAEANYYCAMEAYAEHFGDWNDYHGSYRWQKLTDAARRLGVEVDGKAHRALTDCQMTLGVIKAMSTAEAS